MTIQAIQDKEAWNAFVLKQLHAPFAQSWEWGELERASGKAVVRLLAATSDNQHIGSQWIEHSLPLGLKYHESPYGPLSTRVPSSQQTLDDYVTYLRGVAKQLPSVFLRFEPHVEQCYEAYFLALKSGLSLKYSAPLQVRDTRILTLSHTEEELLADMHQKTRYNIRLAEKKGVTIKKGKQYIEEFIRLNKVTTARDSFVSHPDSHYREMIHALPDEMVDVYVAEYEKSIIAANIVVSFGDTTTYVHGASSSEYRNVMAPYLLQWRQIQDAQHKGNIFYDMWGIAPSSRPFQKSERWAGITRFKNGFGGKEKNFVGAFDLPIQSFWYTLYTIVRKLR